MKPSRLSSTHEWRIVAFISLIGAILRFWAFGRLSLSHFDEGIYAFSGLWIFSNDGPLGFDPAIIAYAPPGFPLLVGLSYMVFGVSDYAAIMVSVVAGIVTIPVVAWLAGRTFGPGAGAASATLCALAMAHVAFSRKALTDVSFLLFWLTALGAGMRFLERPGLCRALLLGVAVGVAQNFKYNGWLAGAIVIVAALAGAVTDQEQRHRGPLLRTFGWGLIAALTASLVYAPWFGFVQIHGGYAALLRHHRGYMHTAGWWETCSTQLGEAFALSGEPIVGAMTGLIAWFAFRIPIERDRGNRNQSPRELLRLTLGAVVLALLCSYQAYLPWWIGLGWTPWLLAQKKPALRVLGASWLMLAVLTPFYHPYARLWLPLHALGWVLMAGVCSMLAPLRWARSEVSLEQTGDPTMSRQRLVLAGVAVACGVTAAIHVTLAKPFATPWSQILAPGESLRAFTFNELPSKIPRGTTVRVYARRPLAFYLSLQGMYPLQLEPSLDAALEGHPAGSWLIDDALMPGDRVVYHGALPYRCRLEIDPITLFDYKPQSAFQEYFRDHCDVYVWPPDSPQTGRRR